MRFIFSSSQLAGPNMRRKNAQICGKQQISLSGKTSTCLEQGGLRQQHQHLGDDITKGLACRPAWFRLEIFFFWKDDHANAVKGGQATIVKYFFLTQSGSFKYQHMRPGGQQEQLQPGSQPAGVHHTF